MTDWRSFPLRDGDQGRQVRCRDSAFCTKVRDSKVPMTDLTTAYPKKKRDTKHPVTEYLVTGLEGPEWEGDNIGSYMKHELGMVNPFETFPIAAVHQRVTTGGSATVKITASAAPP